MSPKKAAIKKASVKKHAVKKAAIKKPTVKKAAIKVAKKTAIRKSAIKQATSHPPTSSKSVRLPSFSSTSSHGSSSSTSKKQTNKTKALHLTTGGSSGKRGYHGPATLGTKTVRSSPTFQKVIVDGQSYVLVPEHEHTSSSSPTKSGDDTEISNADILLQFGRIYAALAARGDEDAHYASECVYEAIDLLTNGSLWWETKSLKETREEETNSSSASSCYSSTVCEEDDDDENEKEIAFCGGG